jgi:hypothetical protein
MSCSAILMRAPHTIPRKHIRWQCRLPLGGISQPPKIASPNKV